MGLSIDNTSEHHALVNIRLGVISKIRDLNNLVVNHNKQGEVISMQEVDSILNVKQDIKNMLKDLETIKANTFLF